MSYFCNKSSLTIEINHKKWGTRTIMLLVNISIKSSSWSVQYLKSIVIIPSLRVSHPWLIVILSCLSESVQFMNFISIAERDDDDDDSDVDNIKNDESAPAVMSQFRGINIEIQKWWLRKVTGLNSLQKGFSTVYQFWVRVHVDYIKSSLKSLLVASATDQSIIFELQCEKKLIKSIICNPLLVQHWW